MKDHLPSIWTSVLLGEFVENEKGKKPKRQQDSQSEEFCYAYIDIEAFEQGVIKSWTDGQNCKFCSDGDFLIVWDGSRSGLVGKALDGAIGSTLVKLNFPGIYNDYAFYFLQSKYLEINNRARGTGTPHVDPELLWNYTFPIPPLNEQKRIVAKIEELFSELDAGEASLRQARAQLGVYRQALLKRAFSGELTAKWRADNPDQIEPAEQLLKRIRTERSASGNKKEPVSIGSSRLQDIPKEWVFTSIDENTISGVIGLVRAAKLQNTDGVGYRYIKMDRVDMEGRLDLNTDVYVECLDAEKKKFSLDRGDILFNTRNSVELVGKVGIVGTDPQSETVYNNNLMRLRLVASVLPEFACMQMCARDFRSNLEKVKKATTSVAAVYGKDLWPLPLAVCSLPEQKEIVRVLETQIEAIEQNEREIDAALERSAALRQSILKRAFSGKLVPQDPNDEPASVLLERIRQEREAAAAELKAKKKAAKKATKKRARKKTGGAS